MHTRFRFRTRDQATSFSFSVSLSQFSIRLSSPSSVTAHTRNVSRLAQHTQCGELDARHKHPPMYILYALRRTNCRSFIVQLDGLSPNRQVRASTSAHFWQGSLQQTQETRYYVRISESHMLQHQLQAFQIGCAPFRLISRQARIRTQWLRARGKTQTVCKVTSAYRKTKEQARGILRHSSQNLRVYH